MTDASSPRPGVVLAFERLREASIRRLPTSPVREYLANLDEAYAVQTAIMRERETIDNPLVGRKVGLTSAAVQQQLGVHAPDFGVLMADMQVPASALLDISQLLQPKIEAEVGFLLGHDLVEVTPEGILAAIACVVPALEIVDSRIRDWDIALLDTVADNASSGMFFLGDARVPMDAVDLPNVEMTLTRNGEVVSTGRGSDCLGDPFNALAWVAQTAVERGRPLREGELVLSGALGPMVALDPGFTYETVISGIGTAAIHTTLGGPA